MLGKKTNKKKTQKKTQQQSGGLYISWQEFDDHAQDESSPEDMQNLQHKQQPVEEVEAEEGGVEGQGVHPCRMYDPEQQDKGRTKSLVRATYSHIQKLIETGQEFRQCVYCFVSSKILQKIVCKFMKFLQN